MGNFSCLIFDADHTLLDYCADERGAFLRLFSSLGVTLAEKQMERCHFLSEQTWTEVGLMDVGSAYIQREYHNLYRSHLRILFTRIFEEFGVNADVGGSSERFLKELEREGNPLSCAKETIAALRKSHRLFVATNGLSSIQRGRLSVFAGVFEKAFISEELGAIKPQRAFFDRILKETGAKKEECLMIGDSLVSDMAGAAGAGFPCCWFNPAGKEKPSELSLTYEIASLPELLKIV